MKKNGLTLVSMVDRGKLLSGVWDPYFYRENHTGEQLSDYVSIKKVGGKKCNLSILKFEPIEYQHIPKGKFLTFSLQKKQKSNGNKFSAVGEQVLLFGTMRAYLGNVLITPQAGWLGMESPVLFPVNSEFVEMIPKDNLIYFWWAFLQSSSFLQHLPMGSGGTRPRSTPEKLSKTPISIPDIDLREEIHKKLMVLAKKTWNDYIAKEKLICSL